MKSMLMGIILLSSISTYAHDAFVACSVSIDSKSGITSGAQIKCLPKNYYQTDELFGLQLMLGMLNKGYSSLEQKLFTITYFKEMGIELKSEAVYPNSKTSKKENQTFTTTMSFVSNKPVYLQQKP